MTITLHSVLTRIRHSYFERFNILLVDRRDLKRSTIVYIFLFIQSCVSGYFQVSVLDHVRCLIVGQLCHYHEHSWRKTIIKEHRTTVFMHISLLEELLSHNKIVHGSFLQSSVTSGIYFIGL